MNKSLILIPCLSCVILSFYNKSIEKQRQLLEIKKIELEIIKSQELDPIEVIDSNYNLIRVIPITRQEKEDNKVLIQKMTKQQNKIIKIIDNIEEYKKAEVSFYEKFKHWATNKTKEKKKEDKMRPAFYEKLKYWF